MSSHEAYKVARELIFGRWRSQILYTGVKLNVLEAVESHGGRAVSSSDVSKDCELDEAHTYRPMRAMACIDLLTEQEGKMFTMTPAGKVLTADHPQSLRDLALFEEGPQHYALWKHLPDMIRDGKQNAFIREFGHHAFEETKKDPTGYGEMFDNAMSSFSLSQTKSMLDAIATDGSTGFLQKCMTVCDVGGGQGHMLCSIVKNFPNIERGVVLEIETVTQGNDRPEWATELGVADRVMYRTGSMFESGCIPAVDAYFMKMILHDWNDEECIQILQNILKKAPRGARVCIVENVVPDPATPHFSKLFDIHMMCWGTGRERTEDEYADLLTKSGWIFDKALYPQDRAMEVIIGVKP